jgi:hypothetical protein
LNEARWLNLYLFPIASFSKKFTANWYQASHDVLIADASDE